MITLALLVFFACGFLLWHDMTRTIFHREGTIIAHQTQKKGQVKIRFADHLIWHRTGTSTSIIHRDAIFTSVASTTSITFINGQQIRLDPQTFISIYWKNGAPRIDLIAGSMTGMSNNKPLAVKLNNKHFKIDGQTHFKLGKDANAEIHIQKGSLRNTSAAIEIVYKAKQRFFVNTKKTKPLTRMTISLLTPKHRSILKTKAMKKNVLFSWRPKGTMLVIAQKRNFENAVYHRLRRKQLRKKIALNSGAYFWRIDDNGNRKSPVFQLTIDAKSPAPVATELARKSVDAQTESPANKKNNLRDNRTKNGNVKQTKGSQGQLPAPILLNPLQ